jgi:hypothetical protein
VAGTWFCTVSGDIYENPTNQPAHLYYDGVDQGPVSPLAGPGTFTLPVVPGTHTLELWIGQANSVGLTAPVVDFDYANTFTVNDVPCDCCPIDAPPRVADATVRFASAAQTVAQAGWNPVNIAATADGVFNTTALSGYNTAVGNTPSTTLRVTYTVTPRDRVRGLRLWNQGGSDLTDADGLNNFTAEFYAGATLLATQAWQGVNGGQAQTFTLPFGAELNGVDRVVLRTLDKQIGGSIAPLWRELQLLTVQQVFPCRRSTGTVEWYSADGVLIPAADLIDESAQPYTVPSLRMNGFFFGDDASGTAENLCNIIPAPSATSGWNAPAGGCYDPLPGNPTMTWTNTPSVEMTFGDNGNGANSGAVQINFQMLSTGTLVPWQTNGTQMTVGEQRWSNTFDGGKRARLTLVSANTTVTVNMLGGSTLGVHWNQGGAVQIRYRVEFFTS